MTKGPDFYDNQSVFDIYISRRERNDSPNDTMEQPHLWDLIGNPVGYDILDLGCGDARVSTKFKTLGASSYFGIEGSEKMFSLAQQNMELGFSESKLCWLEDFNEGSRKFDLAVSSLAFHYLEDVTTLFQAVHRCLKPGGRFIFSVEHPVITSCNDSLKSTAQREAWIVDNYFSRGAREVDWMGGKVTKYHRTIEDHLNTLSETGFRLERLKEAEPPANNFADAELLKRRKRIPLFLIIASQRVES